jgi:hypothetical protein
MTDPTSAQYKALIIGQIGDDENQTLATYIDGLWLLHSAYDAVPGLRYLYALRSAIEFMQGRERNMVNTSREGDRRVDLGQRFTHLQTMYDNATAQIALLEARLRSARGGAIGTITRVRPVSPAYATATDAALLDRMLRGDAFLNLEWRPL